MKRFISSVLVAVIILCCFPTSIYSQARSFSKEEIYASELKELGLFRGVSETNFDLERAPTRVEALVMLIRVLGKEAEALENTFEHPFTDVPGWADNYIGYAYSNGLTNGQSETLFGTGDASSSMYLTFVLRALGYTDTDGKDFRWDDPFTLAKETGLLTKKIDTNNFLRADVVTISHNALDAYLKGSSVTLASKLIEAGVFTKETFDTVYNSHKNPISTEPLPEGGLSSEQIYEKCSSAVFFIAVYDKHKNLSKTGSGFFIDDDGTAVTNYHVIEDSYYAFIQLSDTEEVFEILGVYDYSKENDWAVIKVDCTDNEYLDIGDTSAISGGVDVCAIGSPLGLQNTISEGIISNPSRIISGTTYLQTNAAISQGSSGGALLDKNGHVIGITSAGLSEGQNLNLALPITYIDNFTRQRVISLKEVTTSFDPAASSIKYVLSQSKITMGVDEVVCISFDKITNGMPKDVTYTIYVEDENIAEVYWKDPYDSAFPLDIKIISVLPGTTSFTLSNNFNDQQITVPITVTESEVDKAAAAHDYLKNWLIKYGEEENDYIYTWCVFDGDEDSPGFRTTAEYIKSLDYLHLEFEQVIQEGFEVYACMSLSKYTGRYSYYIECEDYNNKYLLSGYLTAADFNFESVLKYDVCETPEYMTEEEFLQLGKFVLRQMIASFDTILRYNVGISVSDFGFISLYD